MLISRRKGTGRHLRWRVRIFGIGAGLGIGGIWTESRWLVNLAIVTLAAGMLLRFIGTSRDEEEDADGARAEGAGEPDEDPDRGA